MPTLDSPASSRLRSGSPAEWAPPALASGGRSLAEYVQFFALDLVALKHRDVLDVAAGPASFTAEACARRIDAVAVDPAYGDPDALLAARATLDDARRDEPMRTSRRLFQPGDLPGPRTAAGSEAGEVARRFLDDYESQFARGRYVAGALPQLPFFDATFDLVLCAHLLFLQARRFDFDWHLAACRELVRVSAGEVRVHPVGGADGRPYPGLARLRRELRGAGIASQLVSFDGGLSVGTDSMLVLRRTPA